LTDLTFINNLHVEVYDFKMNKKPVNKDSYLINKQKIKIDLDHDISSIDLSIKRPSLELLTAEGGENFYNYIDWLGLSKEPYLVVLSSMHHYYYDADDLKEIKTVVNLIPLNQIRHIKGFFHSIYHLIPHKCYFIGCFADHKKHYGYIFNRNPLYKNPESVNHGILSKIPLLNIIYRMMDARTEKYLSGKNITLSLEDLGFKVLDMTELDGLTYFCTQKVNPAGGNL
jgi:hypothetical protein